MNGGGAGGKNNHTQGSGGNSGKHNHTQGHGLAFANETSGHANQTGKGDFLCGKCLDQLIELLENLSKECSAGGAGIGGNGSSKESGKEAEKNAKGGKTAVVGERSRVERNDVVENRKRSSGERTRGNGMERAGWLVVGLLVAGMVWG